MAQVETHFFERDAVLDSDVISHALSMSGETVEAKVRERVHSALFCLGGAFLFDKDEACIGTVVALDRRTHRFVWAKR